MVDQVLLALAERRLVRDLKEVADDFRALAVEAAEGQTDLRDPLKNLVDLLGQDQPRQVNQDRGPEPRPTIRGAGREVAELVVERVGQRAAHPLVQRVDHAPRLLRVEPARERLQAEVVLLVDHQPQRVPGGGGQRGRGRRRLLVATDQLPADQVALQEDLPDALAQLGDLQDDGVAEHLAPLDRLAHPLQDRRAIRVLRPDREREALEVAGDPNARAQHDVAVRALGAEPLEPEIRAGVQVEGIHIAASISLIWSRITAARSKSSASTALWSLRRRPARRAPRSVSSEAGGT